LKNAHIFLEILLLGNAIFEMKTTYSETWLSRFQKFFTTDVSWLESVALAIIIGKNSFLKYPMCH